MPLPTLHNGEWVAGRLRSGNVRSSDGAAELLKLTWLMKHYEEVLVASDSDFDGFDVRYVCGSRGCYFAFVGRERENRPVSGRCVQELVAPPDARSLS